MSQHQEVNQKKDLMAPAAVGYIAQQLDSQSELMTRAAVCSLFGVVPATLRNWELRGLLRPFRLNARVLRYDRRDVDKLLREAQS